MSQIVVQMSADVAEMSPFVALLSPLGHRGIGPEVLSTEVFSVPFCPKVSHLRVRCDCPGQHFRAAPFPNYIKTIGLW